MKSTSAFLLSALGLTIVIQPAHASVAVASYNGVISGCCAIDSAGTYGSGDVTLSLGGSPSAFIHSHAAADAARTNVTGSIEYSFEVLSSNLNIVVPILLDYVMTTSATLGQGTAAGSSQVNAFSSIQLSGNDNNGAGYNFLQVRNASDSKSVSGTLMEHVTTNTSYKIYLAADAGTFRGGSADAYIDPFLYIDPSFLANNPGLTLDISSGIINSISAVPEPSTWAMLILGFAGLGFISLRQKTRSAQAAHA